MGLLWRKAGFAGKSALGKFYAANKGGGGGFKVQAGGVYNRIF